MRRAGHVPVQTGPGRRPLSSRGRSADRLASRARPILVAEAPRKAPRHGRHFAPARPAERARDGPPRARRTRAAARRPQSQRHPLDPGHRSGRAGLDLAAGGKPHETGPRRGYFARPASRRSRRHCRQRQGRGPWRDRGRRRVEPPLRRVAARDRCWRKPRTGGVRTDPAMPETVIAGERVLTGPQKAAALLLMLGPPTAGRLLRHFDQPDLRAVVRAAAGLGTVAPSTLDRLVEEFADDFSAGNNLLGDAGQARTLLAETLPPNEVDDLIGAALGEGDPQDVWKALAKVPESAIASLLIAERPATATYILSRLDSALAARIVSALPRARRNAALCGLIAPSLISPRAAGLVEAALQDMLK